VDIDLSAPPLLCIGWEVGSVSGAEYILYIDSSGKLTVVETKLRRNPESRREVVGQILEYAAQMSTWTSYDVERQAEAFFASPHSPHSHSGESLRQAMESHADIAGDENFYDQFLEDVQQNIDRCHFRLVIAIDEPPVPLLKTAEFVNRFSRDFELYLVHLKRFTDSATKADIFVPAIFGKVPTPPSGSGPRPSRQWDYDSFFKVLEESHDDVLVHYVTEVYAKFKEWTDKELWGSGFKHGVFNLVVRHGELHINLAAITTRGNLYLNFGNLTSKVPEEIITSLKEEIESTTGVAFPADISRKSTRVPEAALRDQAKLALVLASIKKAVDDIRNP
jgi:hypothetical protein